MCVGMLTLLNVVSSQVEQLDKLEQYPPSISQEGPGGGDGELGALSQEFYQTALQVVLPCSPRGPYSVAP